MRALVRLVLTATLLPAMGCAAAPQLAGPRPTAAVRPAARTPWARVVAPGQVPAAIAAPARAAAQAQADKASEKRDIDYFALPEAPIGLALGPGTRPAWVLGFLGTGETDGDLNVELRALVGGDGAVGVTMNYSGPTTLGRTPFAAPAPTAAGPRFELLLGLPGGGVAEAYGAYMDALAPWLRQRHGARPFAFDDVPLVFAVHEGDQVAGFVFTNQGNRLVLGERKYADVQSVVALMPDARVAAAYTVVAWNRKTAGPGAAPAWTVTEEPRFGTFATCGEAP